MCRTSTVAYSAKPKRQLSLLRRSRTRKTRRKVPSLAPRFPSPVVEATFAPFFVLAWISVVLFAVGLNSFETPLASSSSETDGSRPRSNMNCEGTSSGDASLSPTLAAFWRANAGSVRIRRGSSRAEIYSPGRSIWHLKHRPRVGRLTMLHFWG